MAKTKPVEVDTRTAQQKYQSAQLAVVPLRIDAALEQLEHEGFVTLCLNILPGPKEPYTIECEVSVTKRWSGESPDHEVLLSTTDPLQCFLVLQAVIRVVESLTDDYEYEISYDDCLIVVITREAEDAPKELVATDAITVPTGD